MFPVVDIEDGLFAAIKLHAERENKSVEDLVQSILKRSISAIPETPESFSGSLRRPAYLRVVNYIETHISKPISLHELSNAACMSRFAFFRAWKEVTGTTPMAFVLSRRIAHARHMLANTDIPIIYVSLACGFSSHGRFSTAFGKATNETPSAYRLRMTR